MGIKTRFGVLCLLLCGLVWVTPAGAQNADFTELQLSIDEATLVPNQEANLLVTYRNSGEWPEEIVIIFHVTPGISVSSTNELTPETPLNNVNLLVSDVPPVQSPNFAWQLPIPADEQQDLPQIERFQILLNENARPGEARITTYIVDPTLSLEERVLAGPEILMQEDTNQMFGLPTQTEEDTPEPILLTDTIETEATIPAVEATEVPPTEPPPPPENTPIPEPTATIDPNVAGQTDGEPTDNNGSRLALFLIIIGAIVLGVLVVGFIAWRVLRRPSKKTPTAPLGKVDTPPIVAPAGTTPAHSKQRRPPTQPYLTLADEPSSRYLLQAGQTSLGRSEENDLVIDEKFPNWATVSRRHAVIMQQGEDFYIQDLESRNGIRVEGRATVKNLLRDGWQVSIGGVEFVFHSGESLH